MSSCCPYRTTRSSEETFEPQSIRATRHLENTDNFRKSGQDTLSILGDKYRLLKKAQEELFLNFDEQKNVLRNHDGKLLRSLSTIYPRMMHI